MRRCFMNQISAGFLAICITWIIIVSMIEFAFTEIEAASTPLYLLFIYLGGFEMRNIPLWILNVLFVLIKHKWISFS